MGQKVNKLELVYPYMYNSLIDGSYRRVKKAEIEVDKFGRWYNLTIWYECGRETKLQSKSIRGAKMKFAYKCYKNSKWKEIKT